MWPQKLQKFAKTAQIRHVFRKFLNNEKSDKPGSTTAGKGIQWAIQRYLIHLARPYRCQDIFEKVSFLGANFRGIGPKGDVSGFKKFQIFENGPNGTYRSDFLSFKPSGAKIGQLCEELCREDRNGKKGHIQFSNAV